MKPKLTLLVGPQGSGKSTYRSDDLVFQNHTIISQDEQGKQGHMDLFNKCINHEISIVADRINHTKQQRERYLKPAREAGYETEIVVMHVPRQTCFERIMARENHPTINGKKYIENADKTEGFYFFDEKEKERQANSALDTFFTKYERVEDSEADKVTRLGWDSDLPECVIFDIDGTMANIEHRLHHVKHEIKKNNRWDLFNKEVSNDTVNEWCKIIYHNLPHYYRRVFCSGRVDSIRPETHIWLTRNVDGEYENLFMRHRSDFRKDYIIKEVIYEYEIKTRYNVLFVIDDRKQVVDMWRKHGLVCLQCAEGDF